MNPLLTLYGYRYSVYTRSVRMALACKGLEVRDVEVNPFDHPPPAGLAHPFGRVPVLRDGDVTLYETSAILRHIDRTRPDPPLMPRSVLACARVDQVLAVVDAYGYVPLVRQVFAHRVFRPLEGMAPDEEKIAAGLAASKPVLGALETIASEGHALTGDSLTLADCHLFPMLDYFRRAPEGRDMLDGYPALGRWWDRIDGHPAVRATDPGL